jgi:hypothetical protein
MRKRGWQLALLQAKKWQIVCFLVPMFTPTIVFLYDMHYALYHFGSELSWVLWKEKIRCSLCLVSFISLDGSAKVVGVRWDFVVAAFLCCRKGTCTCLLWECDWNLSPFLFMYSSLFHKLTYSSVRELPFPYLICFSQQDGVWELDILIPWDYDLNHHSSQEFILFIFLNFHHCCCEFGFEVLQAFRPSIIKPYNS